MRKRLSLEERTAIYGIVKLYSRTRCEEVSNIKRGNYVPSNPLVVEMVDTAKVLYPCLHKRSDDAVGAQISICVDVVFNKKTVWAEGRHVAAVKMFTEIYEQDKKEYNIYKKFFSRG